MEITIKTSSGKEQKVKVIRSIYYTIAGERVKFHIHESVSMLGCYTITHAKSAMRVRDYPQYSDGYRGLNTAGVAKKMLKEVIDKIGEEKVSEALIKAEEES